MTINTDGAGNILPNERRLAFRRMSTLYPAVLHTLAHEHCSIQRRDDAILNPTPGQMRYIVQVFAALFAVRMLKSRLNFELNNVPDAMPTHLSAFAEGAAIQYANFRDELFPDGKIITSTPHAEALQKIEQGMVDSIFQAFTADAAFPDFREDQFWSDVFRGIADNPNGADLMRGFEAGWLRNMPLYMQALNRDDEGAPPPVVNTPAPEAVQ